MRLILILLLTVGLAGYIGFYLKVLVDSLWDWWVTPKLSDIVLQSSDSLNLNKPLDIVIPARNEAAKIGRCLESLEHQTFSNFNVWMIDDRSDDDTGLIMQRFTQEDDRFHLLPGKEPPPGWVGKVNAIYQAIPHLTGDWVLFLDADTWLHPENLERTLQMAQTHPTDMLTLLPTLECKTFWEKVLLPAVVLLISRVYPLRQVNDPHFPQKAIANGQYLLFRSSVYQAIGTHEIVKNSVVEDLHLAQIVKKGGYRLRLVLGLPYFKVRMYTSFQELREGWTKNLFIGNPDKSGWVTVGKVIGLWLLGLLPFMAVALTWGLKLPTWLYGLSIGAWAIMTFAIWVNRSLYKTVPSFCVFHPLAMGVVGYFLWESRKMALSQQGVRWKGRYYKPAS